MRSLPDALVVLLLALPAIAHADPIQYQYTFTGVFDGVYNPTSGREFTALNLGEGWVDLSGAAFTITGLVGDPCCDGQGYSTTPTWDFGELGTFTYDRPENFLFSQQSGTYSNPDEVRLAFWYFDTLDFQGISAQLPQGTVNPDASLGPIDATPLKTQTGRWLELHNTSGEILRLNGPNIYTGTMLQITSVKVEAVPEPTTLAVMGVGLAGLWAMRRRWRPH